MDDKITKVIGELSDLAADPGKLSELAEHVEQLKAKQADVETELSALRPGIKNFDDELKRLSGVLVSLKLALEASEKQLSEEIRVRRIEATENTPAPAKLTEQIKQLDIKILAGLEGAFTLLGERYALAQEQDRIAIIIREICQEYKLNDRNVGAEMPWHLPVNQPPGVLASEYIQRFVRMRSTLGPPPTDDKERWEWFSKRRW